MRTQNGQKRSQWNVHQETRGLAILVVASLCGSAGCSSSTAVGVGDRGVVTLRSRNIEHEPCDVEAKSAEKVDANGDGQPDLVVVKNGSKELCGSADLDFDGRVDMWTYFDEQGKPRRRELDYDRDGSIDEIQLFKAGQVVEKQRASTPAKRLDTWEFYTGGRLVRAERDSDGNGRVDQWWDYKTPDCPLIRSDTDGNGEPDPKSVVDYCSESGYKPPEQAVPTTAPMLQKETEALPTETSNRVESSDNTGASAADANAGETKANPAAKGEPKAAGKGK